MKSISAKKLKKLGGKVPFSSITKPSKPLKRRNPKRRASEFKRTYHSQERVLFVKDLVCAACGCECHSVNAHLLGNDGARRKGHYTTIGPLCEFWLNGVAMGCHPMYDEFRWRFDAKFPDFDPEKVAADTQRLWEAANV